MKKLRDQIKSTRVLWASCLLPALLIMLSMQFHIHVHANHQHGSDVPPHSHQTDFHKAHFDKTYDAQYEYSHYHADAEIFSIDVSPEGVNKSFSSTLLACVLIGMLILLIPRQTQGLILKRYNERPPYIRWRIALPPQLRAPPR